MVVGDREREEEREGFVLLKEMKNQDSFFTFLLFLVWGKGEWAKTTLSGWWQNLFTILLRRQIIYERP